MRALHLALFGNDIAPQPQAAPRDRWCTVDMAKIVLLYGKDPEVKKLAEEIIKAQNTEIAIMIRWLAKQAK